MLVPQLLLLQGRELANSFIHSLSLLLFLSQPHTRTPTCLHALVCITVKVRVCVVREVDYHTGQKTSLFIARDPSSRKLRHLAYAHPIHLPSSLFFLMTSLLSLIFFRPFARSLLRSLEPSRYIKLLAQKNEHLHL